MHLAIRRARFGAWLVAATIASGAVQAEPAKESTRSKTSNHGQVFILSGLLGEALSPGLESFADKIRTRGIPVSLASHTSVAARADEAANAYRAGNQGSIVVVGHSLGATAAMQFARTLQEQKIPVRLIVSIGATADLEVPANVAAVVNYYQSASMSKGRASGGGGFRGTISNIDLEKAADTNHFNMVQGTRLQAETMNRIVSLVSPRREPSSNTAQSAPPPSTAPAAQHGVN